MTEEGWKELDAQFSRHPITRREPASEVDIAAAAHRLAVSFDGDYAEFVRRYGGAVVGALPVFGLSQAEVMGDDEWSVVDMTERMRDWPWPLPDGCYVISMDQAGNPIGIAPDGHVYISDHDSRGDVFMVAPDFAGFVLYCLRLGKS